VQFGAVMFFFGFKVKILVLDAVFLEMLYMLSLEMPQSYCVGLHESLNLLDCRKSNGI
jgi:hypothetical protein